MGPVVTKSGHYVTHDITSRDSPIYIGYYDFCAVVPEEYLARYLLFALKSTLHCECD